MSSERKNRKKAGRIAGSILLFGTLLVPGIGRAQEPGGDWDGDGVTDLRDACPQTPPGARPLSQGCSALELARHPEVFLGRVTAGLAERTAGLPQDPAFANALQSLETGRAGIEQAASELRRGEVCRANDTYGFALQELGRGQGLLAQATNAAAGDLLAQRPLPGGDVSEVETRAAYLRLSEGLAVRALDDARAARTTVTAVCDSVVGGLSWSGKVTATQDAQGTITTANGAVALPAGSFRQTAHEGGSVTLSGITFADGTGFATSWNAGVPGPGPNPSPGDCLALRIAPLQKFIFSNGPFTLHDPLAYTEANGALGLEAGMRVAVQDLGCSKGTPPYSTWSYKARIDADTAQGPLTLATDLAAGEIPVELPASTQKITATFLRISCGILGCATPETLGTKTWTTVVRPRASYATAVYQSKTFGVTDNGVANDFEAGRVTGLVLSPYVSGNNPAFSAQGYTVTNGVSSRPQIFKVQVNADFAVYEDDFFDPDGLFSLEFTGVDHAAGLKWPRITGTRNGKTFWYTVQLPEIVRDRVNVCGNPHCFYKLPYTGGWPTWDMGKGNFDDPINAHGGVQKFAFDFGAPEGTLIRAARGGKVIWVVETETQNNFQDPNYQGMGNYMFIAHEDGTYGVYFHMPQNGVFVNVGDRVHRGDQVAKVGNTGNSGGPHLHFESGKQCPWQACPWLGGYDTVKILFDALVWPFWAHETCHLPRVGEPMVSTQ